MLSVVIPAFNEERRLPSCLAALAAQDTEEPFEVIVVDNASTDRTAEVARSFGERLQIRVAHEPQKGRGAARNTGFALARGDIILSTDADACVPTSWIRDYATALRNRPRAVGLTGTAVMQDCPAWQNLLLTWAFGLYVWGTYALTRFTCLNGFNFAVRRDAYERSGGFNRSSDAQEDMELTLKLRKIGRIGLVRSRVLLSGRRFRGGFLRGLMPYLSTFVRKFILRHHAVELESVHHE